MRSMQGVSSALVARNESWVRKEAAGLARRLPANVEKADLIQVGLIAVAQAALGFKWDGEADSDSDEAREAFVRYARMRVKGAMLDELRQMDQLGRAQRRKVKVVQIARERWRAGHGTEPSLGELSALCGMEVDEISALEALALSANAQSLTDDPDHEGHVATQPATPADEVEARVDTAIVLRRLEKFFLTLPERDRQVIDAYLGVGLSPRDLADELQISPTRVAQIYTSVCDRIARHFGHSNQRALDRHAIDAGRPFEDRVAARELQLSASGESGRWGEMMEQVLTRPSERTDEVTGQRRLVVDSRTRWG